MAKDDGGKVDGIISEFEKLGWKFYSNYTDNKLMQKRRMELENNGKRCIVLSEAYDTSGRKLNAMALWYK